MARYRPPQPQPSKYITPEGRDRLARELEQLWRVERPQVTAAVAEAAALGDRSENAEYIYGKKRLREIDRRVRFLRKRLAEVRVVDRLPDDRSRVWFGAWVTLEDVEGATRTWRIVGPDEFDTARGWISMDAPLARALMKRQTDDEVLVRRPGGEDRYWIIDIQYVSPNCSTEKP